MAFIPTLPTASRRAATPVCSAEVCSAAGAPRPLSSAATRRAFLAGAAAAALYAVPRAMAEPTVSSDDVTVGDGKGFSSGMPVKLHYTLTLDGFQDAGGKVVDSSRSRGRPFRSVFVSGRERFATCGMR